jgi:hypothetical protein
MKVCLFSIKARTVYLISKLSSQDKCLPRECSPLLRGPSGSVQRTLKTSLYVGPTLP